MTDDIRPPEQPDQPDQFGQPDRTTEHGQPQGSQPSSQRGSMRWQDPDSTTARPPTVAEQRARQQAQRLVDEQHAEQAAVAARKATTRKRLLVGGGVTVGIAALVGAWYLAAKPDNVTAYCTSQDGTVHNDDDCDPNQAAAHGGYTSGGLIFLPIPGGGYSSYRYNYGGTVSNGHISGGSTAKPQGANINTPGGKSIQRGGFGIGNSGGKSGGS